ncbi:hypothetical protein ACLNAR_26420 [Priestia aryabhattai]|uniref:hypothetical protein n=1 Tax=Priestia aryabhattai TaxID=412384 RepID=UPI00398F6258
MWGKIETVGSIQNFLGSNSTAGAVISQVPLVSEHAGFWESVKRMFTDPGEVVQEHAGDRVYDILHPFLDIVGIVAYPIASIIMSMAGILYILHMREKAITWMTKTSITYVVIQLLPLLIRTAIDMIVSY